MERTINPENVIKWKKVGGGALYLKNRIIKPGQVFSASLNEIPKAFRDVCIPLEEIKEEKEQFKNIYVPEFRIVLKGKSKFLYDVVDAQGKVWNEKGLQKDVAEQLVNDLLK